MALTPPPADTTAQIAGAQKDNSQIVYAQNHGIDNPISIGAHPELEQVHIAAFNICGYTAEDFAAMKKPVAKTAASVGMGVLTHLVTHDAFLSASVVLTSAAYNVFDAVAGGNPNPGLPTSVNTKVARNDVGISRTPRQG